MNETVECILAKEQYEEIITITAYISVSIFLCVTTCVVKFCCCK